VPETLVGGCYNGMISFFDLRKSSAAIHHAVEESVIENSHHDPVYDVFWISSKVNTCLVFGAAGLRV
jgi:dynein intermediate chain 2, axonemal